MVILGCALGASALIVSMLAQSASMNYPEPPVRLGLIPSLIFSAGGGLAGALLAGLFGLLMVESKRPRVHNILMWELVGFGFGVLLPVLTGVFLPITAVLVEAWRGVLASDSVLLEVSLSLFRIPSSAFAHGLYGLYTGMLAGFIFGSIGWVVNRLSMSANITLLRYAPYAIVVLLSIAIVLITALAPAQTLAKLG